MSLLRLMGKSGLADDQAYRQRLTQQLHTSIMMLLLYRFPTISSQYFLTATIYLGQQSFGIDWECGTLGIDLKLNTGRP